MLLKVIVAALPNLGRLSGGWGWKGRREIIDIEAVEVQHIFS